MMEEVKPLEDEKEIIYWWEKLYEWLMYVLFPPYCVICGKKLPFGVADDHRLCEACHGDMPYLLGEVCEICGKPVQEGGLCDLCLRHRPVFEKGIAAFVYDDVREGIARFKYRAGKIDGDTFGKLMADYLQCHHEDWIGEIDVVIPVPLHPKKERSRGFNQSGILCEWIAEGCDLHYEAGVLKRLKHTKAQSKLKWEKRANNLKGVFSAKDCTGKTILLVDDIFTSGATANECSRVLYRSGAKKVLVFCLSHTK